MAYAYCGRTYTVPGIIPGQAFCTSCSEHWYAYLHIDPQTEAMDERRLIRLCAKTAMLTNRDGTLVLRAADRCA
jgi:hypothetical protein